MSAPAMNAYQVGATAGDPLPRRLWAWAQERFPVANAILFFSIYAATVLVARALTTTGPIRVSAGDLAAFAAPWAFFLMLRVLDEHKDYALDLASHPDRVLQRSVITLGHLKVVGAAAIVIQLGVSLAHDGGFGAVTAWWLAVMGWSALMTREFFASEWLARRLVIYAFSHMLVMPLAVLWMAQMGAGGAGLPGAAGWLAALGFLTGAGVEIARKTNAPQQERPDVDSYTRKLGTRGAAAALSVAIGGATAAAAALLSLEVVVSAPLAGYVGLAVLLVAVLSSAHQFARSPSPRRASRLQQAAGLAVLGQYAIVVVAVVATRTIAVGSV